MLGWKDLTVFGKIQIVVWAVIAVAAIVLAVGFFSDVTSCIRGSGIGTGSVGNPDFVPCDKAGTCDDPLEATGRARLKDGKRPK